jgi:UV DNA damage endonuclease
MNNYNLGYACICTELSSRKIKVSTNRTMRKATFQEKGLNYVSEIALQNCKDLLTILKWNARHDIHFFRMSSEIFPWASEYNLEDLKDFDKIEEVLYQCGLFASENNIRLSMHPGPFNKLCSPNEQVVLNTIRDLEIHGQLMDLLIQPRSPWAKINIHVGGAYNDKPMALANFCKNYARLSDAVKTRLTVENDDKESLYSTKELYDGIFKQIGVPIVHDVHHHTMCSGGQTDYEAMSLAVSTWPDGIPPVIHYSQSRSVEYGDPKIKPQAHSDSYWTAVETYEFDVHVMLECKHKEQGLFKMRELLAEVEKAAA